MNLHHLHAAAAAAKQTLAHRDAVVQKLCEAGEALTRAVERANELSKAIGEIAPPGSFDTPQQRENRLALYARLNAERAENDRVRQMSEEKHSGVSNELFAARVQVVDAARSFLDAKRDLQDAAEAEFHRDLAELPLPQLFRKWYAIVRGLDPGAIGGGILSSLESVRIAPLRGHSRTPAFVDEWRSAWQRDPEMVALNAELLDLAKFGRRMKGIIDNAEEVERFRQKVEAERERERRLAERSQNQIIYSSGPQQPLTVQQLSNLWRAEDAAQRAVEGPATADQQEMEG